MEPRIVAGRCVVNGVEHTMRMARPSPQAARRYGLNQNHHVRVWCECMAHQRSAPGELANGPYHRLDRAPRETANDPRRVGGWDYLGVADVRESGSALNLFREHIREVTDGRQTTSAVQDRRL